ncbi:MAG: hypothetical protein ACR2N4_10000 [Jatrophihabitans sp.]
MGRPQELIDRLRIERTVWWVDARLQDLPRRSRIAKRRELRENLQAAAAEVGAHQAVRQLGGLRALALDYLSAEYGDRSPRPSWTAAALWLALVDLVMLGVQQVGESAFRSGLSATGAPAGSFDWPGVRYLISNSTVRYADGHSSTDGGAWTPWVYLLMFGGAVLAGRLWRLLPALRGRPVMTSIGD